MKLCSKFLIHFNPLKVSSVLNSNEISLRGWSLIVKIDWCEIIRVSTSLHGLKAGSLIRPWQRISIIIVGVNLNVSI